jgi:mono/diheme cytochrome c family protein
VAAALAAAVLLSAACDRAEPASPPASANRNAPPTAAPAQAPPRPGPLAGAELAEARRLYTANCAACHLASGKGDSHHHADAIPNFTDPIWQQKESDEEIAAAVENGKGGVMPAFGASLTDAQIALLVRYVRDLPARGAKASDPKPARNHGGQH